MPLARKVSEQLQRDAAYVDQHRATLVQQFGDQWIAVYQGQVVASTHGREHLRDQLAAQGIPPAFAYREYLAEPPTLPLA
jgi:hypothetical protein